MSRLSMALAEIVAARKYTNELLDAIEIDDWFRMPTPAVTHIAWQVGHLAIAQYNLALKRVRGELPADSALIPAEYAALFGRGSQPTANAGQYPGPYELRDAFDRVFARVVDETPGLPDAVLDEPSLPPHHVFGNKLGALLWSARHEMLHAGQIGLLRRLLGAPAAW